MRILCLWILIVLLFPFYSQSQSCNQWLKLPAHPSFVKVGDLDITGDKITVEAMFNRIAPWTGADLYQGDLVSKHEGPNDCNYLLRPGSAEITTSNGYFKTPAICPIVLNRTYHVAMVYDGSTLKFYRNGFLMSQIAASGTLYQNNWQTQIGLYFNQAVQENFLGYINEVRIWNIARTQNEIRSYMNQPLPNPQTITGLNAYYTFDNLLNKQGNSAWNGTLGGSASINETNPACTLNIDSCSVAPLVAPGFNIADTVCVNTPVTITNTSVGASSYYWNFCVASLNTNPIATNIGNPGSLQSPVFIDYAFYNGNYYGFLINYNPGKLVRLNFGNSLLNTPTSTDLGNFGGIIPAGAGAEGIQIVYNEAKWYAIVVGGSVAAGNSPRVLKIEFGANLANNAPTATNWGNIGNMEQPIDLHVFKEGANWYGLTVNAENNTITRFNFTSSFSNTPTGTSLGNIGSLAYPTGIFAINDNGFWRVFVVNGGDNTRTSPDCSITRLDFGTSLLNTPTGFNLGNPDNALQHPRDLTILKLCGETIGFAVNGNPNNNDIVKLNFTSLSSVPTTSTLGNIGNLNFPHSISKLFRVNNDVYSFITNVANNTITRLKFEGCSSAALPNSTLQNPVPVIYNTPGTYGINLTVDEGLPTQDAICKQIVVVPPPIHTPLRVISINQGSTMRIGSNMGAGPYLWNTGSTQDSIDVSAAGTYWVEANRYGCTNRDSFLINYLASPAFSAPDTVCVNEPVTITNTSTGASSYYWSFCAADLNTAPTATNLGNVGNHLSNPVFMDYAYFNGNYYGFLINYFPGKLIRLDFGNSLLNTPTSVDLGNFNGIIPPGQGPEGIQIVFNENKWYALIVAGWTPTGITPRIIKIEFGANLANPSPTATNWGNIGNMEQPIDLHVFKEGDTWYGLTVSAENNTITRFNFTNSFSNVPSGVNLGNIGDLAYPTGIFAINDDGFWRVFITNGGNSSTTSGLFSLSRLDFGSSLLNTPTGINLGNPGNQLQHPRDLTIMRQCGQTVGFAVNGHPSFRSLVKLDFQNNLTNTPTITSFGNIGDLSLPHSISKLFRDNDDVFGFITNAHNNSLTRIKFTGCSNSNVASSTLQNPLPVIYNQPGTYNINLTIDDGLPTQDAFCKSVVVVAPPAHSPVRNITLCQGDSIKIGSAMGVASYTWSTGAQTDSIMVNAAGTYWVQGANFTCANRDSFVVSMAAKPQIDAGADAAFCKGDSVLLSAQSNGTYSYSWSPVSGLNNPAALTTYAHPNASTQYVVTATNAQGCKGRDTVQVAVKELPVVRLGNDTTLCRNDSLLLQAGNSGAVFLWQDGSAQQTFMVRDSGQYAVSVTKDGCVAKDTIHIATYNLPVFSIRGDTSVCHSDSLRLTTGAAGNYTYSWTPATGLSNPSIASPMAYITAPVQYIATVTDNHSCRAKDTIQVGTIARSVVNLGADTAICTGETVLLNAGNSGAQFVWNTGATTPTYTVTTPGIYSVAVTKDGCASTDSVSVSFRINTAFDLQPRVLSICKSDSLTLTASGGDVYEWFTATGALNSSAAVYRGTAQTSDTYFVKITDAVCGFIDTLSAIVTTKPLPVSTLTKTNDVDCIQTEAQLVATGGVSYRWLPSAGLSNLASASPVVRPLVSTTYKVAVTGANGCSNLDSIRVIVDISNAGKVYVPNAFTPNGDGNNDCFSIRLGGAMQSFDLSIFNRWGERVFHTTSINDCWNGYYKGVLQSSDVFVYLVKVNGQCGNTFKKGTFALIR